MQTKNEKSSFNKEVSYTCVELQDEMRAEGHNVTYLWNANNGVSSDQKFVMDTCLQFLEGLILFTAITYPDHNVKNSRYQLVLGGHSSKTIGCTLINTGLIPKTDTAQEVWQVKDFASDRLVLRLASALTVTSVLSIPEADLLGSNALCVLLF